jgi:hypothetical protein
MSWAFRGLKLTGGDELRVVMPQIADRLEKLGLAPFAESPFSQKKSILLFSTV